MRLDVLRKPLEGQLRISEQLDARAGLLPLKLFELRLGDDQCRPRPVDIGWRADAIIQQRQLAVVVGLSRIQGLSRQFDLLAKTSVVALEVFEVGLDPSQFRLRLWAAKR